MRPYKLFRNLFITFVLLFALPAYADTADEVESAIARWAQAFNEKDAEGIVALYAEDAVFFGTTSPIIRDTPELIWDYFKGLSDLGDSTISVADHRIQIYGDTAINTGYYSRLYTDNGEAKSDDARFTFVYQKRGSTWMIVEHHSSVLPE